MRRKVTIRGLMGIFGAFVAAAAFLSSGEGESPSSLGFAILWIFALVYLDHIETHTQATREAMERIADRTK